MGGLDHCMLRLVTDRHRPTTSPDRRRLAIAKFSKSTPAFGTGRTLDRFMMDH